MGWIFVVIQTSRELVERDEAARLFLKADECPDLLSPTSMVRASAQSARILRTGPTITSQKRVKDEKVYKPHFSPEFGGFSLERVGEFRLNPGSRTKFANLPDFAMRWLVHS